MIEMKLPELGEGIDKVDVTSVLVATGDTVKRDQPILEVETEKASLEVPADADGTIAELLVSAGDKVAVGAVIVKIDPSGKSEARPEAKSEPEPQTEEPSRPVAVPDTPEPAPAVIDFPSQETPATIGRTAPASPSTRRLARELGVDILQVQGSGPGGRISRNDVKAHTKTIVSKGATAPSSAPTPDLPDVGKWGPTESEELSNVRRATVRAMATSWSTIPAVTQFDDADITDLEAMRKRFNTRADEYGAKLTVTAILMKAVAVALKRFPKFNAVLDLEGDRVIYRKYVNVGVAVDTPRGLLVPVVKDVDVKGIVQVAQEMNDLASRARDRKLKPDEMAGAGFTVTNLGGLGTTYFSPIVNWPEVAILGVGKAKRQPVWQGEGFEPRLMMPLSLTYDHRLIDGADTARFLRFIAESLEQPLLMLEG